MHDYTTYFDATKTGWTTWPPLLIGVFLMCVGAAFLLWPRVLMKKHHKKPPRAFAIFYFCFATFWTVTGFHGQYGEYKHIQQAAADHELKTVEGTVEKFVPMPYSGHATEHFCVKDACFAYSDFMVTSGFNRTLSHGGPLHEGLPVRITYLEGGGAAATGNIIVKLEIAEEPSGASASRPLRPSKH